MLTEKVMSRSNKTNTLTSNDTPYQPPEHQYWIGKDKPKIEYSTAAELHWYEAHLMGYKPTAWPKYDNDRDDDRFNLKEKE